MRFLSRSLARVTTALRSPSTPGKHSLAGLAQRRSRPTVSAPQTPFRTPIAINGDALPMVRPYVVVAEARRKGAASW